MEEKQVNEIMNNIIEDSNLCIIRESLRQYEGTHKELITKQDLHKIEMELVNLCEDNEVMKEAIINKFTDLMNKLDN